MTLRIRLMLRRAFPRLAVPNAPVQTFDLGDDYGLRRNPVRVVVDNLPPPASCAANESRCGISLNLESCPRVDQKVSVRATGFQGSPDQRRHIGFGPGDGAKPCPPPSSAVTQHHCSSPS